MADLGNYGENLVGELLVGAVMTGWTRPVKHDTIRIRLWTTMPDEARAGGVEVTGGSYAAQDVTNNDANWTVTGAAATNDNVITFPTATADWGTILGATVETTSDDLIALNTFTGGSVLIENTDVFSLAAGDIDFTFA